MEARGHSSSYTAQNRTLYQAYGRRNLYDGRNEGDLEREDAAVPVAVEPLPGTMLWGCRCRDGLLTPLNLGCVHPSKTYGAFPDLPWFLKRRSESRGLGVSPTRRGNSKPVCSGSNLASARLQRSAPVGSTSRSTRRDPTRRGAPSRS